MENIKKNDVKAQGAKTLEEMENDLLALENALNGLRTAFAFLQDFHRHCEQQYKDAVPEREEVV